MHKIQKKEYKIPHQWRGSPKAANSKFQIPNSKVGQSLIELLTGVAIVSIFLLGAVLIIIAVLKIGRANLDTQTAQDLSSELVDNVRAISNANWQNLYSLSKGSTSVYFVTSTINGIAIMPGTENLSIDNISYSRYFYVENICRDDTAGKGGIGDFKGVSSSFVCAIGTEDPSSQRVTASVTWLSSGDSKSTSSKSFAEIMTRFTNVSSEQGSWRGGPVGDTVGVNATTTFASSTNIDYSSSTGAIIIQNP